MKWPTRKPGLPGAPTNADAYAQKIKQWLDSRPFHERERVVAATKTFGEIEARLRFCKDGRQEYSLWLCVPGSSEALRLIPAPLEDGPHAGDVR